MNTEILHHAVFALMKELRATTNEEVTASTDCERTVSWEDPDSGTKHEVYIRIGGSDSYQCTHRIVDEVFDAGRTNVLKNLKVT